MLARVTKRHDICRHVADILSIFAINLLFFELKYTVSDTYVKMTRHVADILPTCRQCRRHVGDMSFQHRSFSLVKHLEINGTMALYLSIHSLILNDMFVEKNVLLIKKNWEKGSVDNPAKTQCLLHILLYYLNSLLLLSLPY